MVIDLAPRADVSPGIERATLARPAELVHRLRGDHAARPLTDPGLAGGLREWLADGLAPLVAALEPAEGPLVVTRRMLTTRRPDAHRREGPAGPGLVRAALLGTVFRQRLSAPSAGDPMAEATAGLRADGYSGHVMAGLAALTPSARRLVAQEVREVSERVTRQWTPLPGAWLPRTRERLAVPIGGRLVLTGVADLLLGRPGRRASVCVVSLRTGAAHPVDGSIRRLLALLETIRSGVQPYRVASYYATTGLLEVEDVTEAMLTETVASLIERISALPLQEAGS